RKVISVSDGNLITGTEPAYAKHAPYQWNVQAGVDSITANLAQFVCATLAGRAPKYAGSPQRDASTRKFGLIYARPTAASRTSGRCGPACGRAASRSLRCGRRPPPTTPATASTRSSRCATPG